MLVITDICSGLPKLFSTLASRDPPEKVLTGFVHISCEYLVLEVGHAVAQLVEALRYKPEDSIPDGVIGIFQRHNPFGRTMAVG